MSPTYDYYCKNCNFKFERFQSIKSNPLRKCPKCKKIKLKRLIGMGGGIIFKGSGFYATDYRDKPQKTEKSENEKSIIKKGPANKKELLRKNKGKQKDE